MMNAIESVKTDLCKETLQYLPIQSKFSVSAVDNPLEYEANFMADKVMRMPEQNFIQRKCAHCEEEEKAQRKPLASFIQKKQSPINNTVVASDNVSSQIQSTKNGGNTMHETTKSFMESRFGTDFSNVNIHTGNDASQLSNQLNAQAFTVGNDIYFNEGKYQPNTDSGRRLLAHELTHVIQQNRGTPGWLHGATQGLTIQRQTGTDYGLAGAGSQNKYVAEAVRLWTTKKSMKINDFVDALMGAIKTDLLSQGVPELKWNISTGGLGPSGLFNKWLMTINPTAFTERKVKITTVADLTLDEVREVVGTLYHESRHADQQVLVIRVLLDQKKSVHDIVKETEIPLPIVNAVQATKFKTPPDAAQVAHATRAFAVMYGAHKELMQFLVKNEQVVPGVQELVTASSAKALKTAAPHLKKWAAFSTTVLEPKVKNLNALKTLGAQEAQLKQDLGALIGETSKLVADLDSASKMKDPYGR